MSAAVAVAAIPDEGVIHGCHRRSNGTLRVIDKATGQHCVTGERALDWNERGRRGGGALADHIAWDDVQDGSIHVRRQVLVPPRAVRDVRRVYVRDTLKNRRPRRVRLDDQTASELRRWKAEQNAERLVFDAAWKTDGGVRHRGRLDRD